MSVKVPIIQTVAALESMRKRGITLENAILECVDNSWDWMGNSRLMNDARIRIHVELNADDTLTVSILDSGEGITTGSSRISRMVKEFQFLVSRKQTWTVCRWHSG